MFVLKKNSGQLDAPFFNHTVALFCKVFTFYPRAMYMKSQKNSKAQVSNNRDKIIFTLFYWITHDSIF